MCTCDLQCTGISPTGKHKMAPKRKRKGKEDAHGLHGSTRMREVTSSEMVDVSLTSEQQGGSLVDASKQVVDKVIQRRSGRSRNAAAAPPALRRAVRRRAEVGVCGATALTAHEFEHGDLAERADAAEETAAEKQEEDENWEDIEMEEEEEEGEEGEEEGEEDGAVDFDDEHAVEPSGKQEIEFEVDNQQEEKKPVKPQRRRANVQDKVALRACQ
ncbi:hypothetical protein CYMTET_31963 [Cymbomonas tetramitiformis]|uniref:Uncharacterized protein n=1 Tax=Cymbomonas tetramitiformis TaxID=36881 RepID=A0AAE0FGD7_9CHLO|nr:hypothetical protein CYMTET_31963 [Cymbomonas tetramitiformis]